MSTCSAVVVDPHHARLWLAIRHHSGWDAVDGPDQEVSGASRYGHGQMRGMASDAGIVPGALVASSASIGQPNLTLQAR